MKLIRDKIHQIPWKCEELKQFVRPVKDSTEHDNLLRQKLLEEVGEFIAASDPGHVAAEAADVFEALITMCERAGVTKYQLYGVADQRLRERGGFSNGMVLDFGEKYGTQA